MAFAFTNGSGAFDSLGQTDMEISAPDQSSATRQKWVNLSSASQDAFGVPIHVIPLSKLSSSKRKSLALQLRSELEQIQLIQKKVESHRVNAASMMGSGGNIVRNGSTMKDLPGGIVNKSFALNSGLGKHPVASGQQASGLNPGVTGRFKSANKTPVINPTTATLFRQCDGLLKKLMTHQFGWVFNKPVDPVELKLPDYFDVIKHPMDFGTIKKKIESDEYSNPLEFSDDVRLTFANAMTYNPSGNDVHIMADTMRKFFETRWKPIQKKIDAVQSSILHDEIEIIDPMAPCKKRKLPTPLEEISKRKLPTPLEEMNKRKLPTPLEDMNKRKLPTQLEDMNKRKLPTPLEEMNKRKLPTPLEEMNKRKHVPERPEVVPEQIKQKMTDEQKRTLSTDLESSVEDLPDNIIDFLRKQSSNGGEEEIEIDIDALDDDALFTLRRLLDELMQGKKVNTTKAETCEMELPNESGLSNSSMQFGKETGYVDEDIDIGGNAPTGLSYPSVEIEKDSTLISNQFCNAESIDDTDSSSSSESESECPKADVPTVPAKDSFDGDDDGSNENCNEKSNGEVAIDENRDRSPTERQASYRAAILMNRFADTILKAREKTLGQGDKADPEKLRRERGELEMLKRKEKARLQAEAMAAEDARKRVEAEAAAEAKRIRELEREAARQALLKMEKTVEINENSRFLEDLEMLSGPLPLEHLPSSVDETSPDDSQDGLGSFKFGSSNPLEQLGLYMKVEDEDEEPDAANDPDAVNDVEEGEID